MYKCNCGTCTLCKIFSGIVTLFLTLTTIAAAIGVYATHSSPDGWIFGSQPGSLALITFIISIVAWLKIFRKMCPCGSKGCSCSGGSGSGCGCGGDGVCPACGKDPCKCI